MRALRVASTQFELRKEKSVQQFLAHVGDLVTDARQQGAELVVFPELASIGLLGSIDDHEVTTTTVSDDYRNILARREREIVEGLVDLAKRHDVTLLGGSHTRIADDGSLRNTAYVVHPDGRVETQDKIQLTPPEQALGITPGDELLITRVGPFTAGVLICADIQFPELSRYLVDQGVNLILCPSLTWNRRGVNRVRIGCQARAMENQLFVVMSPLVGSSGLPIDAPMYTVGKALVTGPIDRNTGAYDGIVAISEATGEDILLADLDLATITTSRENPETPGLALRRLDLYERLRAAGEAT